MEFDSQHRLIARHSATDAGTIDYEYSYDPVTGFLSAIRSSNGQKQSFSYDANGNLRSAVLPTGEIGFKFSERGDLLSISENQQSATFAPAAGGLFASMTTSPKSVTKLQYNSANELREITFPGGVKSSFTYEPSGLRSSLALSSGGGAEYSYDPAGNLTESKVFDKKHKQTNGQKLEMDSAYQLTRWTLFDGTVTEFKYDPSGNLTEIKKGSSLTRFEYDEINRLIAVITPDGQRLTYAYKPGERSLIEQHQHAAVSVEDLRDTGLTFSSSLQVSATRSVTGLLGAVRFSETLGTFQLSGSDGTDVVEPHERFITALSKLFLFNTDLPANSLRFGFNIPFNTIFMPAEYASINCCPVCTIRPPVCDPCFPPPPPDPTVDIQIPIGVALNGTTTAQVSISPSATITLSLSTTANTTGSATFDGGATTTTITGTSVNVTIHGNTTSSTVDNITLTAVNPDTDDIVDQRKFSVVSVVLSLRNSGTVSPDDGAGGQFALSTGSTDLGSVHGGTGVEIVGTVTPSGFTGPIVPHRTVLQGRGYRDSVNGSTLVSTNDGASDDSSSSLTDIDPQSGASGGKIYDLDEPSCSNSGSADGTICRLRANFREWATLGDAQVSNDLFWFSRVSNKRVAGADQKLSDITGDNTAGVGSTSITWNLQ